MNYYILHTISLVTILVTILKEIDIKNHTWYYFDNIIGVDDLDLDEILLNEVSCGNYFFYDVAYKTS